jgi:hypothetical protein
MMPALVDPRGRIMLVTDAQVTPRFGLAQGT